jgi:hypothetical protein
MTVIATNVGGALVRLLAAIDLFIRTRDLATALAAAPAPSTA